MAKFYHMAVIIGSCRMAHHSSVNRNDGLNLSLPPPPQMKRELPTRKMCLDALNHVEYDILIVGGGAVGTGCALEAATRGLKTALVEADDFGSGTSSKSSKLLHGGLRDLEQAIRKLDLAAFRRVRMALRERSLIANLAPHLNQPVPLMLPIHHWWQTPIYWVKLSIYHLMAPKGTKPFHYISADEALEAFPMLRKRELCGAYVFYEGQHDDARMCLSVALTAARYGADICNHMRVVELIKDKNSSEGNVVGVKAMDQFTGKTYKIKAKMVINATGHLSDDIRIMEEQQATPLCTQSWSSHIVLPRFYCPEHIGLFDPHTKDGKAIFFLPWQGHTLVGTTNETRDSHSLPQSTELEVQFLLEGIRNYVNPNYWDVRRCDVLAAWGGFKTLPVESQSLKQTQLRNHVINLGPGQMISIVGGTWTSFRLLAEKAVNAAVRYGQLEPLRAQSVTGVSCKLDGASGWTPKMFIRLVQDFGMERDVALHLANTYGSNAFKVAVNANSSGKSWPIIGKRLHSEFPYIEAEVKQGIREHACTITDMIARRLRVAFLNVQAAEEMLPNVANIMAAELKWSRERKNREILEAQRFLYTEMGQLNAEDPVQLSIPIKMSIRQVRKYAAHFRNLDDGSTGYVSISDCCKAMKSMGLKEVPIDLMHNVLRDIDCHTQGKVNLYEFLLLMSAVVHGDTAYLRYAKLHMDEKMSVLISKSRPQSVAMERSGGGL